MSLGSISQRYSKAVKITLLSNHEVLKNLKADVLERSCSTKVVKIGCLFRLKSFWIGCHYSDECRRFCINVAPCFTVWIVLKGGRVPKRDEK